MLPLLFLDYWRIYACNEQSMPLLSTCIWFFATRRVPNPKILYFSKLLFSKNCCFPKIHIQIFLNHELTINYKEGTWFLNTETCPLVKSWMKIWPQRFYNVFLIFFSVCGRACKKASAVCYKKMKKWFFENMPFHL